MAISRDEQEMYKIRTGAPHTTREQNLIRTTAPNKNDDGVYKTHTVAN